MKNYIQILLVIILILISTSIFLVNYDTVSSEVEHRPLSHEEENTNPDKHAEWTPEQAARHQEVLRDLSTISATFNQSTQNRANTIEYANGALAGTWSNRGPKNMPGAFKFSDMLDGTDIMYAVTHNHYPTGYSSKSYIFKGTVYNPNTGSGGDDFELITANWPNRYKNLFVFHHNGNVRLVAHIENGPLYYSDDDGGNWAMATGLPPSIMSSAINRQSNHEIYVTDGQDIYKSTNKGESFTLFQSFGSIENSALYSPRYANQPNSDKVYLARAGAFYTINNMGDAFVLNGTFSPSNGNSRFSIAGDSRKLYVTENQKYWVSTDMGSTWEEKFPHGNHYGNLSGPMAPGRYLAVSPEDEDIVVAGYVNPVMSLNGLDDVITDHTGWGRYQGGNDLPVDDYHDKIRFNYHPDFQSTHFFYNASGDLFTAKCTDGGVFISYKEWTDIPPTGDGYDNSGYANAHFININTLNTINPLIYRKGVFTGHADQNHIFFATQDQGTQMRMPSSNGTLLDFYQNIGGDGPAMDSYDGIHVWRWKRTGSFVHAPVEMYDSNGDLRTAMSIKNLANANPKVDFTQSTTLGWVQTHIDHDDPDGNLWILSKKLDRATWDGTAITGHTVDKGVNQIAALAQGWSNPNKLFMLQDAKVFISSDRGDTFGSGINTPFSKTPNNSKEVGSGVVLPTNDNWILFCGASVNSVGSILSKDGGATWIDVTGIFPSGEFAQTGGMVATSDGKFVFAGTDVGPYVFDVETETWHSIAEGMGFFNATDVDYLEDINTIRFGSWGSGILDFKIENTLDIDDVSNDALEEKVLLYPNPVEEYFYLETMLHLQSPTHLEVVSISGKKVLSKKVNLLPNEPLKISLINLTSGLYIVQLQLDNKQIVKRIVKK